MCRIRPRLGLTPNFGVPEDDVSIVFLGVAREWHEAHVYSENDTMNKDVIDL